MSTSAIRRAARAWRGTALVAVFAASFASVLAACETVSNSPVGPDFHRVERGDTVAQIARNSHQSIQNIVRWNDLKNADAIEIGQVLRVTPPPAGTQERAEREARASRQARGRATREASAGKTTPQSAQNGNAAQPGSDVPPPPPASSISLAWPASGKVIHAFDGRDAKGIDIANAPGTPVVAAAAGTVVYAGSSLRGYGNLVIIKHNEDYLSAYAHNRVLLVKDGQYVTQGQKIAEMGDTDSNRVMLHFELRYQGRSIDPARYLPAR